MLGVAWAPSTGGQPNARLGVEEQRAAATADNLALARRRSCGGGRGQAWEPRHRVASQHALRLQWRPIAAQAPVVLPQSSHLAPWPTLVNRPRELPRLARLQHDTTTRQGKGDEGRLAEGGRRRQSPGSSLHQSCLHAPHQTQRLYVRESRTETCTVCRTKTPCCSTKKAKLDSSTSALLGCARQTSSL